MMKTLLLPALMMAALAGCKAGPATPVQEILPLPTPSLRPEPTPTESPKCPEVKPGTLLLENEPMGYCLLYPDDLQLIGSFTGGFCLVPAGPTMGCHNARSFVAVEEAAGRSADQVADALIAQQGFETDRSTLIIDGEQAVVLASVPAQDSLRTIMVVHEGRLYELRFVLPYPADPADVVEQFERLYSTVLDSIAFIPPAAAQAPEPDPAARGTAEIVFVKDGNILAWEEATGGIRSLYNTGDVIRVEVSPDGQMLAFVRRAFFAAGGFDANEQSALWVMRVDGSNLRELVSARALRTQLNAAEANSTNFPRLAWIPNSQRLLYSGNLYNAHGYGEGAHTPLSGVYVVDAVTSATEVLAPAAENLEFAISPDGEQVALVSTTSLSMVDTDGRNRHPDLFVYPAYGVPGAITPMRIWTKDSSAVLITGPIEEVSPILIRYTVYRVPADGSPAQAVITLEASSAYPAFSPDGARVVFDRWAPRGPAGEGGEVRGWIITGIQPDLGPLEMAEGSPGVMWSPSSNAYALEPLIFDPQGLAHGRAKLFSLCPNAVQAVELCSPAFDFGEQIESLEWLDQTRFLYVTYAPPRRLLLGSLDGSRTFIAEDPFDFAAVPATCRDDSEFVADVTIPDGTRLAPGTVFNKVWRLRNSGDCPWGGYRFTYLSGDRMSGPRSIPVPVVQPGGEVDLTVTLIAPEAAGLGRGVWQMFTPAGEPFGARPYVEIEVE